MLKKFISDLCFKEVDGRKILHAKYAECDIKANTREMKFVGESADWEAVGIPLQEDESKNGRN